MSHDCIDLRYIYTQSIDRKCRILITTVIIGNTIIHQKHNEFQPCVGDNVVMSGLTSALKDQGNVCFGWSHDQY